MIGRFLVVLVVGSVSVVVGGSVLEVVVVGGSVIEVEVCWVEVAGVVMGGVWGDVGGAFEGGGSPEGVHKL